MVWILVLNPPRERPIAWSSPSFFRAGAVLMSPHDGAVDHRVFVVGIGCKELKDPFPDPGLRPPAEAAVDVLPLAEAFGQIAPGNASPVAIDNGFYKQAIVRRGHANGTLPTGHMLFDPVPLVIAQGITAHRSAPKADRLGIEEPIAPESGGFCEVAGLGRRSAGRCGATSLKPD
jgi:hypothetical protein